MKEIGIGIIGGGYMGKAHAVAMSAVGAVFNTNLRPRLEMVCGSSPKTSKKYCEAYGFKRAANTWEELVKDEKSRSCNNRKPAEHTFENSTYGTVFRKTRFL
ncbi:MAG: hypothetical protein CM15mP85_27630 [Rhodobacterales bacterium]|nr:MAG: hypothetical protein CM15mP85_27630 [Rhodobacterales bacterium]